MNDPPDDPCELLARARRGEPIALGQLFDQHTDYLVTFVRLQLGRSVQSKVEARDVVQEATMDALRQFSLFRGESDLEFSVWFRRIVSGKLALTMRQYLGTKSRDVTLEQRIAHGTDDSSHNGTMQVPSGLSTASQHAMRQEESVLLAQALTKLPPKYRTVVIERCIDERPFREIAERLSTTEDSVQKMWVRALTQLRGSLGTKL